MTRHDNLGATDDEVILSLFKRTAAPSHANEMDEALAASTRDREAREKAEAEREEAREECRRLALLVNDRSMEAVKERLRAEQAEVRAASRAAEKEDA